MKNFYMALADKYEETYLSIAGKINPLFLETIFFRLVPSKS